ncbi:MAG: ABC transporter ATP-binding protein [Pseudomonadota bacterium]
MSAVEFKRVFKLYLARAALQDFSLEIETGERLVLLGPSGCGKTTVLRLLAGFIPPDRGVIVLDGEVAAAEGRILKEPEERGLGMVFQDLALWPHLSVRGNLEFGLKARGIAAAERERRIRQALQRVRLEHRAKARPSELSGGEQQRVALARALISEPHCLLMDEPLASLDFELNLELRREIRCLQEALGFTLIYVTHNLEEAFSIAQRVAVIKNGTIDRIGPAEDIRAHFEKVLRGAAPPASASSPSSSGGP